MTVTVGEEMNRRLDNPLPTNLLEHVPVEKTWQPETQTTVHRCAILISSRDVPLVNRWCASQWSHSHKILRHGA